MTISSWRWSQAFVCKESHQLIHSQHLRFGMLFKFQGEFVFDGVLDLYNRRCSLHLPFFQLFCFEFIRDVVLLQKLPVGTKLLQREIIQSRRWLFLNTNKNYEFTRVYTYRFIFFISLKFIGRCGILIRVRVFVNQ